VSHETVIFALDFAVKDGSIDAFQSIAETMTAGTRLESGAVAYDWFLSIDRTRCRLIEIYKNADAVLAHGTGPVVRDHIPKLLEHATIARFEVYGDPGVEATAMLLDFGAEIFQKLIRLAS
jgi:quinol monooxygenase YgiN